MIQNTNYGASKTYVNTKVDKLTTSGLKAYTHDGATQGEIDVSNTYTPSTLALRDSNGRLIAADPARGATDKTLTTANWVSQTGSGRPNNLIHNTGDEPINGVKPFIQNIVNTVNCPGNTSPNTYFSQYGRFRIVGNDDVLIAGLGIEKSTSNAVRIVLNINGNKDTETGRQTQAQIHFILDEVNGIIRMQAAHVDKNGTRTFGTASDLMTWTP